MNSFLDKLGNEKSNRGTRNQIYDLAKRVQKGKFDVSKESDRKRAAKVQASLEPIFRDAIQAVVGSVKECHDNTAARIRNNGVKILQGRDSVLSCSVEAEGESYELYYIALNRSLAAPLPAAGFELSHVEVSRSAYRFRGKEANQEIQMISMHASLFKGKDGRAAPCRRPLRDVRTTVIECDEPSNNGGTNQSDPCDGSSGNGGPCTSDIPVTGEVFVGGDCDSQDPCTNLRAGGNYDRSSKIYRVGGAPSTPRATGPAQPVVQQPSTQAPVVDRCGGTRSVGPDGKPAPVVPGSEDC
jgi:hypothetical protein